MGYWGRRPFESDEAMDWLEGLDEEDSERGIAEAIDAIASLESGDSIDEITAVRAVAAAECIASSASIGKPGDGSQPMDSIHFSPAIIDSARSVVTRIRMLSGLQSKWDAGGRDAEWHRIMEDLERRST